MSLIDTKEDVIEELIALNPAGIAYISCNPRTFARDLKQFLDHGFSLDSLKAYDMIPQSSQSFIMVCLLENCHRGIFLGERWWKRPRNS